jgi:2,4-dienoyl-CoA reductase-like NADH-dependent reductase (Old Yellow Enzyme family)
MGSTFEKPRAASEEDIANIVGGFAHAAEYLEKAGYDGMELNAAPWIPPSSIPFSYHEHPY